jgi:hypothetical protein
MSVMEHLPIGVLPTVVSVPRETKTAMRKRLKAERAEKNRLNEIATRGREIERQVNRVSLTSCSQPWTEAIVYRGEINPHSFFCGCADCKSHFFTRREPTPARESAISIDCEGYAETPDTDTLIDIAKKLLKSLSPFEVISKLYLMYPNLELSMEAWRNSPEARRIGGYFRESKSTVGNHLKTCRIDDEN